MSAQFVQAIWFITEDHADAQLERFPRDQDASANAKMMNSSIVTETAIRVQLIRLSMEEDAFVLLDIL